MASVKLMVTCSSPVSDARSSQGYSSALKDIWNTSALHSAVRCFANDKPHNGGVGIIWQSSASSVFWDFFAVLDFVSRHRTVSHTRKIEVLFNKLEWGAPVQIPYLITVRWYWLRSYESSFSIPSMNHNMLSDIWNGRYKVMLERYAACLKVWWLHCTCTLYFPDGSLNVSVGRTARSH